MSALNILQIPGAPPDIPKGMSVNVVAQFSLGLEKFDTNHISAIEDIGLSFNKKRFVAATYLIKTKCPYRQMLGEIPVTQDVTALIFHTSKVVLIGASNAHVARDVAYNLVYLLHQRMPIPITMSDFRVENIVASFFLGFEVDLYRFVRDEEVFCQYEPEDFTVSAMAAASCAALLFSLASFCLTRAFFAGCYLSG